MRVLELEIRLKGWGNPMMRGLGWELRNTDGPVQYH